MAGQGNIYNLGKESCFRDLTQKLEKTYTPKNPCLKCGKCDKICHSSDICQAHLKCDYCGWQGHTIDICR